MARPDQSPRFGAVITAMVTPFADDGSLDVDGAAGLARWLAGHGSDALVLAGTTGEGPVLADRERAAVPGEAARSARPTTGTGSP